MTQFSESDPGSNDPQDDLLRLFLPAQEQPQPSQPSQPDVSQYLLLARANIALARLAAGIRAARRHNREEEN